MLQYLASLGLMPGARERKISNEKITASSRILQTLKALASVPSAGPPAAFSYIHVSSVVLLLGDEGQIGRNGLSKRLGLGEGATRTIIKHLARAGIIDTLKLGCFLTRPGEALYKQLRSKISKVIQLDAGPLALGKSNVAIMVRGLGTHVKQGLEQRDAALLAGARGAVTLLKQNGEYVMPVEPKHKLKPLDPLVLKLESYFHPRDNDVLIIAGAQERTQADYGAMAAAFTLFD